MQRVWRLLAGLYRLARRRQEVVPVTEQANEPVTDYFSYPQASRTSISSLASIVSNIGKQQEVEASSTQISEVEDFDHQAEAQVITIKSTNSNSEMLVMAVLEPLRSELAGEEITDEICGNLPVGIYIPQITLGWRKISEKLLQNISSQGVYLFVVWWYLRSNFQIESSQLDLAHSRVPILHCACKDWTLPFRGRIGPINLFVPRQVSAEHEVHGLYVSLLSEQVASLTMQELNNFQIANLQTNLAQLRAVHRGNNRLWLHVAQGGVCVGMQVLNTRSEERQLRARHADYHHERPLVLPGGHYFVEGVFKASFLNSQDNQDLNFNEDYFEDVEKPKIVLLTEGSHLIRVTTVLVNSVFLASNKSKTSRSKKMEKSKRSKRKWMVRSQKSSMVIKSTKKRSKSMRRARPRWSVASRHLNDLNQDWSDVSQSEEEELDPSIPKTFLVEVVLDCAHRQGLIALDYHRILRDFTAQ